MLEIKSFGSGSAGNCYTIDDGQTKIMLEAGINIKDIKKAVNFNMASLSGVLISHSHMDHAKAVKDVVKAAVNVYMSDGTADELAIVNHRIKRVAPRQAFRIGTFKVLPFEVEHDTEAPFGYLIESDNGAKLLFATDTYYLKFKFKGISHLMVEVNYSEKILNENVETGRVEKFRRKRLLRSHFSLENFKEFIKANDFSKVEEIWLLHLSDTNSDEALFKREIAELTGVPIYVAK